MNLPLEKIRENLQAQDCNISALSRKLGISATTLQKIKNGHGCNYAVYFRLSEHFKSLACNND